MTLPSTVNNNNRSKAGHYAIKFGRNRRITGLDPSPDPFRRDNLDFKGFRDGMGQCGNGLRSINQGIN